MAPTRRDVLASLAAGFAGGLALPAYHRGALAQGHDVDVAIVGAGAAGLAAAGVLAAAGLRFVVVEARGRIGGRVQTDTSLGPYFDAGAQFIHWADRNPWVGFARAAGMALTDDGSWTGPPRVLLDGRPLSPQERAERSGGWGRLSDAIRHQPGMPDISMADAVKGEPTPVALAALGLAHYNLGEEPQRVSIADWEQLWAGENMMVAGGYGTLLARYAAGLPVALSTLVTAIAWDGPGVVLTTDRGEIRAARAIVTVPVGVLQAGAIRFTPALPTATAEAIDGLGMGALTKIALAFDPQRLPPLEPGGYLDTWSDGRSTSFEFDHRGQPGLALAMLGGDHARAVCDAGEDAAIAFAMERLVALAGADIRRAFRSGRLAGWWADPFARGSYSIARPGRVAARAALRATVGDRLFFAGEATAGGGAMTVGGATLDGERAARAVLALKRG